MCPHCLFSQAHESDWINTHPNDLITLVASLKAISLNLVIFWGTRVWDFNVGVGVRGHHLAHTHGDYDTCFPLSRYCWEDTRWDYKGLSYTIVKVKALGTEDITPVKTLFFPPWPEVFTSNNLHSRAVWWLAGYLIGCRPPQYRHEREHPAKHDQPSVPPPAHFIWTPCFLSSHSIIPAIIIKRVHLDIPIWWLLILCSGYTMYSVCVKNRFYWLKKWNSVISEHSEPGSGAWITQSMIRTQVLRVAKMATSQTLCSCWGKGAVRRVGRKGRISMGFFR